MLIKDEGGGGYEPIPHGLIQAVCYGAWDLGIQQTTWKGETKTRHRFVIGWEVAKRIENPDSEWNGKRMTIHKEYTATLSEKSNFYKDLKGWFGVDIPPDKRQQGFNPEKLVGKNCCLMVVHRTKDDRTYANVEQVTTLAEGMLPLENEYDTEPPGWVVRKQGESINNRQPEVRDELTPQEVANELDGQVLPPIGGDEVPF
jgi:hypothetical protein